MGTVQYQGVIPVGILAVQVVWSPPIGPLLLIHAMRKLLHEGGGGMQYVLTGVGMTGPS